MHGILPALITTYDDEGNLDTGRYLRVVDQLIDDGVDGFFVAGSTGEFPLLALNERKELLEAVIAHVTGRAMVVAHIGAMETRGTIELAKFATEIGVSAIAAVTPFYYEHTHVGLADYYRRIHEVSDLPLLAYHIPGLSHVNLPAQWFVDLAEANVIQGVKYTSSDLGLLAEIRRKTDPEFTVLCGADGVLLAALALGADGGIGSTYNAIPAPFVSLYSSFRQGDIAQALAFQHDANSYLELMQGYDFLAFLRQALEQRGLPVGESRAPLPVLTSDQKASINASLKRFSSNPV